jgi:hypothetical protein
MSGMEDEIQETLHSMTKKKREAIIADFKNSET